jgi:hypothetical protein
MSESLTLVANLPDLAESASSSYVIVNVRSKVTLTTRLHPRRDCVEVTFNRKLPKSAFPLRQQPRKRRRVEAMLARLLH